MKNLERTIGMGAVAVGLAGAAETAEAREIENTVEVSIRGAQAMQEGYATFISQAEAMGFRFSAKDAADTKLLLNNISNAAEHGVLFWANGETKATKMTGGFAMRASGLAMQCEAEIVRTSATQKHREVGPVGMSVTQDTVFNTGVASELTIQCTTATGQHLDLVRVVYFSGNTMDEVKTAGVDAGDLSIFSSIGASFLTSAEEASRLPNDVSDLGRRIILQEAYISLLGANPQSMTGEVYGLASTLQAGVKYFAGQGVPLDVKKMQPYLQP